MQSEIPGWAEKTCPTAACTQQPQCSPQRFEIQIDCLSFLITQQWLTNHLLGSSFQWFCYNEDNVISLLSYNFSISWRYKGNSGYMVWDIGALDAIQFKNVQFKIVVKDSSVIVGEMGASIDSF